MKITIKGFLTLKEIMGSQAVVDVNLEVLTVEDLLYVLANKYGEDFKKMIFDPKTHTLNRDVRVLINGGHYSHLPEKLKTRLREGDEVFLFPAIAGG